MKLILLFFCVGLMKFGGESSLYSIQLQSLDGTTLSMSSFKGKKIIIAAFNAARPPKTQLRLLDSIQQSDMELAVIVIPSLDSGGTGTDQNLRQLRDSLSLHFIVTRPALVKKAASTTQNRLFKWLTDASENLHFNVDWESEEQVFVINGKGTLYAVLGKGAPISILQDVLKNPVDE